MSQKTKITEQVVHVPYIKKLVAVTLKLHPFTK